MTNWLDSLSTKAKAIMSIVVLLAFLGSGAIALDKRYATDEKVDRVTLQTVQNFEQLNKQTTINSLRIDLSKMYSEKMEILKQLEKDPNNSVLLDRYELLKEMIVKLEMMLKEMK